MELYKTVQLGRLLDIYGKLLTNKKREMLSMYVNDNMSYQEIADTLGISKPAVLDSIKIAEAKLKHLEQMLGVLSFRTNLENIVNTSSNIKQDLNKLLSEV